MIGLVIMVEWVLPLSHFVELMVIVNKQPLGSIEVVEYFP